MNAVLQWLNRYKVLLSVLVSLAVGLRELPQFLAPADDALTHLIAAEKPSVWLFLCLCRLAVYTWTPGLLTLLLLSTSYVYLHQCDPVRVGTLPAFPLPQLRDSLFVVLGELHRQFAPEPSAAPRWLTIPERGLYTGIIGFGAIGTGKTSCLMYPVTEQVLAYQAIDRERRIGGLVLEVKGNFCHKVHELLKKQGREEDYVEVGLDSSFAYNPLHSDLSPYALAYGIASLMNNIYGRGKEPFWQQAYTNMIKFIILLHRLRDGYITFFDIYQLGIDPELLEKRLQELELKLAPAMQVSVPIDVFLAEEGLDQFGFDRVPGTDMVAAPKTSELLAYLKKRKLKFEESSGPTPPGWDRDSYERFLSVKRWFEKDWQRIDPKLRCSITEGISVFLSNFDDPVMRRVFCPPREAFDPGANAEGQGSTPLPPFSELIEQGKVVALNLPQSLDPGLARAVGTMMKLDFQRAVQNRIARMAKDPSRHYRPVLFLCDEYQAFVTCGGEADPTGDDKFFALSREAKCIPIVATQSISSLESALPGEASWRTLLQCFRTKIFLCLSDHMSAQVASELCGKREVLKPSYTITENGQETMVSPLTGRAGATAASISTAKQYGLQMLPRFEPSIFLGLKNAQAIVLPYDGVNPGEPTYCFLKPYYLDANRSYFEQVERGEL